MGRVKIVNEIGVSANQPIAIRNHSPCGLREGRVWRAVAKVIGGFRQIGLFLRCILRF